MIFDELIECLKDVAPFDTANIVLLNDDFSARDALANREMPPAVSQRYAERWFNREEDQVYPSHMRLQHDPRLRVMRVSDFTPRLADTEIYDEVLSHWDHHWIAGLTCRDGSRPIGNLGLGRPPGAKDFTRDDLRRLDLARPYVSQALGVRSGFDAERTEGVEHAMVCADRQGRVLWDSANAWRLLRWASGTPLTERPFDHAVSDWARPLLSELARRVRSALEDRPAPPAAMTVVNAYGEFVLRAYAMNPAERTAEQAVGVQVERRLPQDALLYRSPLFRALSGREQCVARGLVRGAAYREIAEEMGVSPATVMSHVRNLYARLDVHYRQELAARLLSTPQGRPH